MGRHVVFVVLTPAQLFIEGFCISDNQMVETTSVDGNAIAPVWIKYISCRSTLGLTRQGLMRLPHYVWCGYVLDDRPSRGKIAVNRRLTY